MKAIAVVDSRWGIGYQGRPQVMFKPDLQHFKELTVGGTVILGSATMRSMGERPLKDRTSILMSQSIPSQEGFTVCSSVHQLLHIAPENSWVIGGEAIYRLLLPYCTEVHITELYQSFPADRYFPNLNKSAEWFPTEIGEWQEYDNLIYRFLVFERLKESNLTNIYPDVDMGGRQFPGFVQRMQEMYNTKLLGWYADVCGAYCTILRDVLISVIWTSERRYVVMAHTFAMDTGLRSNCIFYQSSQTVEGALDLVREISKDIVTGKAGV